MKKIKRVTLIVMDSVGIGALPDAGDYGDAGADTLPHAAAAAGGVSLPALEGMGLGRLADLRGSGPSNGPVRGCYGKMAEISKGKDTTTGHWEMAGVIVETPFPVYPRGFPADIISAFEKKSGRKVIGNAPASGTEIIRELGEEHLRTGSLIVYTSADSVFQIAAHEDVVPLEELYRLCREARAILAGPHAVGRVIARPFIGKPGSFQRTRHRHDFSLDPPGRTLLDRIQSSGLECWSVGKIWDIFAGRGITRHLGGASNQEVMAKIREGLDDPAFKNGLLFANLVDFDMLYNHREDPRGFIRSLREFDDFLPRIVSRLGGEDALLITADHGNDPTDGSTDHSREYVPVLGWRPGLEEARDVGVRGSFADLGQTVAELLGTGELPAGESFAGALA